MSKEPNGNLESKCLPQRPVLESKQDVTEGPAILDKRFKGLLFYDVSKSSTTRNFPWITLGIAIGICVSLGVIAGPFLQLLLPALSAQHLIIYWLAVISIGLGLGFSVYFINVSFFRNSWGRFLGRFFVTRSPFHSSEDEGQTIEEDDAKNYQNAVKSHIFFAVTLGWFALASILGMGVMVGSSSQAYAVFGQHAFGILALLGVSCGVWGIIRNIAVRYSPVQDSYSDRGAFVKVIFSLISFAVTGVIIGFGWPACQLIINQLFPASGVIETLCNWLAYPFMIGIILAVSVLITYAPLLIYREYVFYMKNIKSADQDEEESRQSIVKMILFGFAAMAIAVAFCLAMDLALVYHVNWAASIGIGLVALAISWGTTLLPRFWLVAGGQKIITNMIYSVDENKNFKYFLKLGAYIVMGALYLMLMYLVVLPYVNVYLNAAVLGDGLLFLAHLSIIFPALLLLGIGLTGENSNGGQYRSLQGGYANSFMKVLKYYKYFSAGLVILTIGNNIGVIAAAINHVAVSIPVEIISAAIIAAIILLFGYEVKQSCSASNWLNKLFSHMKKAGGRPGLIFVFGYGCLFLLGLPWLSGVVGMLFPAEYFVIGYGILGVISVAPLLCGIGLLIDKYKQAESTPKAQTGLGALRGNCENGGQVTYSPRKLFAAMFGYMVGSISIGVGAILVDNILSLSVDFTSLLIGCGVSAGLVILLLAKHSLLSVKGSAQSDVKSVAIATNKKTNARIKHQQFYSVAAITALVAYLGFTPFLGFFASKIFIAKFAALGVASMHLGLLMPALFCIGMLFVNINSTDAEEKNIKKIVKRLKIGLLAVVALVLLANILMPVFAATIGMNVIGCAPLVLTIIGALSAVSVLGVPKLTIRIAGSGKGPVSEEGGPLPERRGSRRGDVSGARRRSTSEERKY